MPPRILYLYSELAPYNIPVIRQLVAEYRAEFHIVSWNDDKLKPYEPPPIAGVRYYPRSEFTAAGILKLAKRLAPSLVYVSGWMDKDYLSTARHFRSTGVPVVCGFDDIWVASVRQRLGTLAYPLLYGSAFSHAWVAGPRQYQFAKRLGFSDQNTIFDLLTCDYPLFAGAGSRVEEKRAAYPKQFLYVGNFRRVKGVDVLIKAFRRYKSDHGGAWNLLCVGNGELLGMLEGQPDVDVRGFASQDELVSLCASAGAFVLPSRHDQWGVVVHEFASAGLPLLLSENVGAKSTFLIEGFNGTGYAGNSPLELAAAMARISSKTPDELVAMGRNSTVLASRITPTTSAANLMSVLGA
jgi:glycosyltransferase involved in cell wall biosynthesis